jgi:DNA invertase Pin-like site-specific DNA recombinase
MEIPMNIKVIAYYRVSTAEQGSSGLGLEAQRKSVEGYLNGGDWEIIGEFTEVESGKRSDRPELIKALALAKVYNCPLVVAKVDRLTRSVAFLSKLLEAGVDVRFADLPQIEGPTGRFMLQQMAAVAELEGGLISLRTKQALAAAKARGVKIGGFNGYVPSKLDRQRSADRRAAIAKQRAKELAPIIAQIKAQGAVSLREIAAGLNARGIPTATGKGIWDAKHVSRVLERI